MLFDNKLLELELNVDTKTNEKIILDINELKKFDLKINEILNKDYCDIKSIISRNKIEKILMNMLSYYSSINNFLFEKLNFNFKEKEKLNDVFKIKEYSQYKEIFNFENNKERLFFKDYLFINLIDFKKMK